jgi:hypothetical protein
MRRIFFSRACGSHSICEGESELNNDAMARRVCGAELYIRSNTSDSLASPRSSGVVSRGAPTNEA